MTTPCLPAADADPPRAPYGVLVVDDQPAVREGLARLIACGTPSLRYVVTAASIAEAVGAATRLHPEVVVLDVDLDGEDGLALMHRLAPDVAVLVLTSHGDAATRERAARLGALAFIEKHQPAAELLVAIERLGQRAATGDEPPGPPGTSSLPRVAAISAVPAPRGP